MDNPMKIKALTISLATAMIAGCTGLFTKPSPIATATQERLTGIWAMIPLRNGIANVVEFGADGKSTLHSFNCIEPEKHEPEVSDFKVSNDGRFIRFKSPARNMFLKILALNPQSMELSMDASYRGLGFDYLKVDKVKPLCELYPNAAAEIARRTPFSPSDFVQSPGIPAHPDIQRYIGKWADDKGHVLFEIVMNSSGGAYLYSAPDKNWKTLFNDVSWVGNELHFQSFAYSDIPNLYKHPDHKARIQNILRPNTGGTLLLSFFVGEKRLILVLNRTTS